MLGSLEPDCWLTPACLPHSPALAKALQLAAQAFSTATVTAASAQARLLTLADQPVLTLAGLTAICIAHSIRSKVSAALRFRCHYRKQAFDGSCTVCWRSQQSASPSVQGKLVQAASFWTFLCKRSEGEPVQSANLCFLCNLLHMHSSAVNLLVWPEFGAF